MTEDEWSDALSSVSDISFTSEISDFDDAPQSINIEISEGSPLNLKDFTILHFNINSVLADDRISKLTDICNTTKCSALILTETKLDSTISDNLLKIPGYHEPLRHDRPHNGRHAGLKNVGTACTGGTRQFTFGMTKLYSKPRLFSPRAKRVG